MDELKVATLEKVRERTYWTDILSEAQPAVQFPYLSHRLNQRDEAASLTFTIPSNLSKKILESAGESDLRMFTILMTVTVVLMHRYSGKSELLTAAPIIKQKNTQTGINNILPLKVEIESKMNFRECLQRVKEAMKGAFIHQNYPVKSLLDELWMIQKKNQNYFGFSLMLENLHQETTLKEMNTDLLISFKRGEGDHLSGGIFWNLRHYDQETIRRLSSHFCTLAEQALNSPEKEVSEYKILSDEELEQMKVFNQIIQTYPEDKSIVELFQEQVRQKPDHLAVVFEDVRYTYREVDDLSERIAMFLRKKNVNQNEPIGLMVYRSAEMIIAILGILKAGCPYLPIDVHLPVERICYMLENSCTKVILTNSTEILPIENRDIILIDDLFDFIGNMAVHSDKPVPTDLAYVLYTSGTTGNPKGVMVEHRQVINLVHGLKNRHLNRLSLESLHIGMLASHIFDASVQTMFPALLLGHTLYIAPDNIRVDGKQLWSFYEKNHIHVSDATPSHLRLMTEAVSDNDSHCVQELKLLLVGGEILTSELVNRFLQTFKKSRPIMTNNYGPTECSVQSTAFIIPEDWNENVIPIGSPMPNEQIYIVDSFDQLVPIGIFGELCISGDGVARGYINQPELTNRKFTWLPSLPDKKVYRTGDLARWRSDGLIEFLGRNDNQVKIRGFRVELDEIKQALLNFRELGQCVREVVVVPQQKESQDQFLCAYIISDKPLNQRKLREFLSTKVPSYMIPRHFIRIDKFPMNISGKLDYRALPDPAEQMVLNETVIKAHNETEKRLISIFSEILNISASQISIEDNFFDIGGNSFNIVELSHKILKEFHREISVLQLFQFTSVSEIAALLNNTHDNQKLLDSSEDEEDESFELENIAQLLGGSNDE
ncbi:non-ribosomal peptide synthetase [Bacillus bingmayongensis]|uniref:non-ribosomal peptide synthetase n=1 Tax=Bacillus bingmayongensis TaxID=1150157 RepID=UPI001C8E37D8|nr:non-ribosomal peptide synthetase [Bacillus bingmayongensis]MBY0596360.1 amino acid adenylation domain-containing protein [Bacillus bingmayongensis]